VSDKALLLIPNIGRQKYSMRGSLHGRNMLILEYLWISYCKSLGPGEVPDESFRRSRKQVSSHIQVLKNFYKSCKYCWCPMSATIFKLVNSHS
jgi:transcriptional enhancer factor